MTQKLHSILDHVLDQVYWWLGLVAFLAMAFSGEANLFPLEYHHYLTIAGIAGTAISGYMLRRPPPNDSTETPNKEDKL